MGQDTGAEGGGGGRVDWSLLMEQLDGNPTVVRDVVEAYVVETREHVERLPQRLASGDIAEVRRRAHILGGAMRTFGLERGERLARELEQLAASGSLDVAGEVMEALLVEARRVIPELERFVETDGEPAP